MFEGIDANGALLLRESAGPRARHRRRRGVLRIGHASRDRRRQHQHRLRRLRRRGNPRRMARRHRDDAHRRRICRAGSASFWRCRAFASPISTPRSSPPWCRRRCSICASSAAHYLKCEPLVVGDPDVDLGIRINVDRPDAVGADRLVNTVAAHERYKGAADRGRFRHRHHFRHRRRERRLRRRRDRAGRQSVGRGAAPGRRAAAARRHPAHPER